MAGRHNKYETCTLWFCDEPHYGRGLCAKHYQNWLRTGNPLPEQANDLRFVLDVVDTFRDTLRALIAENNGYLVTTDGILTVLCKCKFCGKEAQYKHEVEHAEGCPVMSAETLLAHTESNPPEDKYTYEL